MISLEDGTKQPFDRVAIDIGELRLVMIDERFKKGITDYSHAYFNLKQLHGLQLVNEFPDMERRQQEAATRTHQMQSDGAFTGAVLGGMIDSAVGEDDSILDGVVFGAALGAATAGVSKIDLKEQSHHHINLLFKNGESCRARVDAAGISDLFRAWHKTHTLHADCEVSDHTGYLPLSDSELSTAREERHQAFLYEHHRMSNTLIVAGVFLMLFAGAAKVVWLGMSSQYVHYETVHSFLWGPLVLSVVLLCLAWYRSRNEKKSLSESGWADVPMREN